MKHSMRRNEKMRLHRLARKLTVITVLLKIRKAFCKLVLANDLIPFDIHR